jgi:hypothetical protein
MRAGQNQFASIPAGRWPPRRKLSLEMITCDGHWGIMHKKSHGQNCTERGYASRITCGSSSY